MHIFVPVSLIFFTCSPTITIMEDIVPPHDAPLLNSTNISCEVDALSFYKSIRNTVLVHFAPNMSFNFSSDSFSPSVSNDTVHIEPPLESATTQWPRTQSTMTHSQVTNHPSPDSLSPVLTQQAHTADISCSVNPLFIDTLAKEHGLTEEKYRHHLHFFCKGKAHLPRYFCIDNQNFRQDRLAKA